LGREGLLFWQRRRAKSVDEIGTFGDILGHFSVATWGKVGSIRAGARVGMWRGVGFVARFGRWADGLWCGGLSLKPP
jgi:hypothetical protein